MRGQLGQRLTLIPVAVVTVFLAFALTTLPASPQQPPPESSTTLDPRAEQAAVRDRQASLAAEIDVLEADEAQLRAALADLEANVVAARRALADADQNLLGAQTAATNAEAEAAAAREWLDLVRDAVAAMAVEAYISPPGEQDLSILSSADNATDAMLERSFLDLVNGDQADLLDELRRAIAEHEASASAAQRAAGDAERSAAELSARLDELDAAHARQVELVQAIQLRLDARLAEADALESLDAELAAQIRDQELTLVASLDLPPVALPPPPAPAAPPGGGGGSTSSTAAPTTSPPTSAGPTSTAGGVTSTTKAPSTTTSKPATTTTTTGGGGGGGKPVIVGVRGIWVAESIADELEAMLAAAEADGIVLKGGGYRDPDEQIALRKAHCGPTEYDIWYKPASECTPPTARPGMSMHERGLAVDFTYQGKIISTRSSVAFQWLAANAAAYGFYNLPSEPWHWSVNGN